MQLTMFVLFYLCHLFGPGDTDSLNRKIKDCKECIFEASDPHCKFNICTCDSCKSNEDLTKLNNYPSNPCFKEKISFKKMCILYTNDVTSQCKSWENICTLINSTDLNVTLISTENTVEKYTTQESVTPSPNYTWTFENNITTTTTTSSATFNETKDLNRYNTTTLNATENSAYEDNESQARKSILIGLIVGMILLFILLLFTIIVIWRLRLRTKARELMANNAPQSSTMTQPQKSLTTGIQPLGKYEDGNIYHQLDNTYGDSKQIAQYKTILNSTDTFSSTLEAFENGLNVEFVTTSITPKACQDIINGSNAKEGSTYFILEEKVLGGLDNSIVEKVAKGSYFVLGKEDKIASLIPHDAALAGDSVSRSDGYSRFGDTKRQTTNEYDTFDRINEDNLSIKNNSVDNALQIIATGAQSDQTAIYEMATPPILQKTVLNIEEEILHVTDDSKYPKLEADQNNCADTTYFVLEDSKDDFDSTMMSSDEIQETQTVTNYSRLRETSLFCQHDYNILTHDKDPSDIANDLHADS